MMRTGALLSREIFSWILIITISHTHLPNDDAVSYDSTKMKLQQSESRKIFSESLQKDVDAHHSHVVVVVVFEIALSFFSAAGY